MEKSLDALRHSQAKCSELERTSKKLQEQTHADRKEIVRLKEELQAVKSKVSCCCCTASVCVCECDCCECVCVCVCVSVSVIAVCVCVWLCVCVCV